MAETAAWVELMEDRLENLEKLVFGDAEKDAAYPKDAPEVIDTLAGVNGQINTALAGRKSMDEVMLRLNDLERFMDPAYTDKLTLSQAAKAEIIFAEEDLLRQQAANLEKVEGMINMLNSEHIKAVPTLKDKLLELSKIQVEQQDQTSEFTDEVKDLLQHYNGIITLLSKQFVQWDELVTKLEAAKQVKKVDD